MATATDHSKDPDIELRLTRSEAEHLLAVVARNSSDVDTSIYNALLSIGIAESDWDGTDIGENEVSKIQNLQAENKRLKTELGRFHDTRKKWALLLNEKNDLDIDENVVRSNT